MAKWSGLVGYACQKEVSPGVWKECIISRKYYGDIIRNNRSLQNNNQINDGIGIANTISLVSDPYALKNFHTIRYVEFMGTKWKALTVDVEYPRLTITLGGIYNG
jgi:hypothetical protein